MLYVNGKLLNTKSKDENYEHIKLVKEYHQTIKDARDYYGDGFVIETKRQLRIDPVTKFPRYPSTRGLLLRQTSVDDEGNREELLYSKELLSKKDGSDELKVLEPTLLISKGSMIVDLKKDPDLAFYVLKCGYVGRTEGQNRKFHIKDDKAKSKANVAKRQDEVKVGYLIYTALPETNIRTLAKSWGISSVDSKDVDVIREELYAKVETSNKAKATGSTSARGYKEFIESAQVKFDDQIAALCSDADEKGFLVYDTSSRIWNIDYKDGGQPYLLKEMDGEEAGDPMNSLVAYLTDNQDARRKLEGVMNRPLERPADYVVPESSDAITIDKVQEERSVLVLKKWIKELTGEAMPKKTTAPEAKEKLLGILAAASVQG